MELTVTDLRDRSSSPDPWAIARSAPDWLALTRWQEIGLPVQMSSKLEQGGLHVVGDIAQLSRGQFRLVPYVGAKLMSELAARLVAAIDRGTSPVDAAKAKARTTPLITLVDETLGQLPLQHGSVASQLMGWSENCKTAAEIASSYGLSVRRIYTVENEAIALLRAHAGLMTTISDIVKFLDDGATPIVVGGIADLDTRLAGFFDNQNVAQYLLSRLVTPAIFIIAINGETYLSWIKQAEWNELVRRARGPRGALAQALRKGGSKEQIEIAFSTLLPDRSHQFVDLLVTEAKRAPEIVEGKGDEPRRRKRKPT
jgi:hypothetical protein